MERAMATTKVNYEHSEHPHIEKRKEAGPVKRNKHPVSLNAKVALLLTRAVGTMWCAYVFAALAFFALPDAVKSHSMLQIIQWLSQTFIQLVMLSVIMVGQNILGEASDRRAELTYKDAEATFHEARQIQSHLQAQDEAISKILDRLEALEAKIQSNG
jgi:hypothetical protein